MIDRSEAARKSWATRRNLSTTSPAAPRRHFPLLSPSEAPSAYILSANGLYLARVQLTDDQATFLNDTFHARRQPMRYAAA